MDTNSKDNAKMGSYRDYNIIIDRMIEKQRCG